MTHRASLFPALAAVRWTVWCSHEKVSKGAWMPLLTGLSQRRALEETITRGDCVRRNKQPCQFRALPEGERPDR